jgi:hypothetical protein
MMFRLLRGRLNITKDELAFKAAEIAAQLVLLKSSREYGSTRDSKYSASPSDHERNETIVASVTTLSMSIQREPSWA